MGPVTLTAFTFLAGLTACGLAGSAMELLAGKRLAFAEPYVSPAHVARSLAATAFAGPFMLANDALDAWRRRDIAVLVLASCLATVLIWIMALGTVLIAVASRASALLGS
jgi:hypothetical protein